MGEIPEDLQSVYEATKQGRYNVGTWSDLLVRKLIERIAAMEAENGRLRAALESLLGFHALTDADDQNTYWCTGCDGEAHLGQEIEHESACIVGIARAALAQQPNPAKDKEQP